MDIEPHSTSRTPAYDDRIFGSAHFVQQLKQEKDIAEKLDAPIPLPALIRRVAEFARIDPRELCQRDLQWTFNGTLLIC